MTRPAPHTTGLAITLSFSLAVWLALASLVLGRIGRLDEAHLCAILAASFGAATLIVAAGMAVAVGRGM